MIPERPMILVIDDDSAICRMVQAGLERDGQYQVIFSTDPKKGISEARRQRPDLILLDITMPGMDGLEVLKRLKAKQETVGIPVLMLTAVGDEGAKQRARYLYNDDYLVKPVSLQVLRDRVAKTLSLTRRSEAVGVQEPPPPESVPAGLLPSRKEESAEPVKEEGVSQSRQETGPGPARRSVPEIRRERSGERNNPLLAVLIVLVILLSFWVGWLMKGESQGSQNTVPTVIIQRPLPPQAVPRSSSWPVPSDNVPAEKPKSSLVDEILSSEEGRSLAREFLAAMRQEGGTGSSAGTSLQGVSQAQGGPVAGTGAGLGAISPKSVEPEAFREAVGPAPGPGPKGEGVASVDPSVLQAAESLTSIPLFIEVAADRLARALEVVGEIEISREFTEREFHQIVVPALQNRFSGRLADVRIRIHSDGIAGSGTLALGDRLFRLTSEVGMELLDDRPQVIFHEIRVNDVRMPRAVVERVQTRVNQLIDRHRYPIRFRELELMEGAIWIEGELRS